VKSRNQTRKNKSSSTSRNKPRYEDRKEKFPLAPVIVIGIIVALIVATVVAYQIQNSDDDGDGNPNGNNGGGGGNGNGDLPAHAYVMLDNVNGGVFSLEDHRGKIVIIDMFATWCGPCALQMDELLDFVPRYSSSDVVVLSVDTDLQETTVDVLNFMQDYPDANWPVAMSNRDFNGYFPASSIPTLYILDRDLEIVFTEVGVTSSSDLQQKVNNLL
jgi:thiol-disulfide isomerase/thioredoxin